MSDRYRIVTLRAGVLQELLVIQEPVKLCEQIYRIVHSGSMVQITANRDEVDTIAQVGNIVKSQNFRRINI